MTIEMPPGISQNEEPEAKHSRLHIGRDTLFVVAGVMIGMSAGITPVMSIILVRESARFVEVKILHRKEKP
jgi:hypothetical protein